MRQDNYYSILGIPFHANSIDIKKAYRRKALLYHPDTHHHDEHKAAKFQLVQMAYLTLSNTDKRAEYNRTFFAKQDTIKIKFHHSAEALIESVIKINKSLSSQISAAAKIKGVIYLDQLPKSALDKVSRQELASLVLREGK